ncbi:hypothetical protein J3F84DRAFT_369883 [Trichoderma pleuroticola]
MSLGSREHCSTAAHGQGESESMRQSTYSYRHTAFDHGKYSLWPLALPLAFLSGIWQGTFGTATGTSGVRRQSYRIATKTGCTSLAIWLKACCRHSFASHGVNAARWSRALLQASHAVPCFCHVLFFLLLARAFCAFSRAWAGWTPPGFCLLAAATLLIAVPSLGG